MYELLGYLKTSWDVGLSILVDAWLAIGLYHEDLLAIFVTLLFFYLDDEIHWHYLVLGELITAAVQPVTKGSIHVLLGLVDLLETDSRHN